MGCDNNTCGTGDWGGPQPGDPNNDITLSANTVYGGINVVWSYPTTNPHAVAHTILYRGTNSNFAQAVRQAVVAGSVYYDKLDPMAPTEYYYWIQMVSINGTTNPVIGPASTFAHPRGNQTLESLTGLIDAGVLAQSLKTQIDNITLVDGKLATEIQNRINSNAALSAALTAVQTGVTQAMTFVQTEITQRQTNDSALVTQMNTLATAVANNFALFLEEKTVRTTKDESYVSNFQLLFAYANNAAAALQTEQTARVNADGALAQQIQTAQTSLQGNIASVQVNMQSQINTVNGKVTEIGALYTVKVDVNGLVGGFGIYNNGQIVEAGFDVDRFWIGRTGPDKVKPFIIDGGVVYIDKARIRDADIDTLKIAGNAVTVPSSAYTAGSVTASNFITAQTLSVNSSGAPALITFGAHCYSDFHQTLTMTLTRDGVQLFTLGGGGDSTQMQGEGMETASIVDNPGAGTHTYVLSISSPGHSVTASARCITYLEVKR